MVKLYKGITTLFLLAALNGCGKNSVGPDDNQNNNQQNQVQEMKVEDVSFARTHANNHNTAILVKGNAIDSLKLEGFLGNKDYSTNGHRLIPYSDSIPVRLADSSEDVSEGKIEAAVTPYDSARNPGERWLISTILDTTAPNLGLKDITVYDKNIKLADSLGDVASGSLCVNGNLRDISDLVNGIELDSGENTVSASVVDSAENPYNADVKINLQKLDREGALDIVKEELAKERYVLDTINYPMKLRGLNGDTSIYNLNFDLKLSKSKNDSTHFYHEIYLLFDSLGQGNIDSLFAGYNALNADGKSIKYFVGVDPAYMSDTRKYMQDQIAVIKENNKIPN